MLKYKRSISNKRINNRHNCNENILNALYYMIIYFSCNWINEYGSYQEG